MYLKWENFLLNLSLKTYSEISLKLSQYLRIIADLLKIGKNYSNRLIYNFPHVPSKFSQNFRRFVNFLKIPDFYFLILFSKCRKKFLRILYSKVFEISLKFPQNVGIHTNFFRDILITNFLDFFIRFRYNKHTVPRTDQPVQVLRIQVYMVKGSTKTKNCLALPELVGWNDHAIDTRGRWLVRLWFH